MDRAFIGWEHPLCETVPAWLFAGHGDGMLDLRDTVLVLPTRQASRRLRTVLPLACAGGALLGPEIMTAAALLRPPLSPRLAGKVQVLLAWCEALCTSADDSCEAFLGRLRPSGPDTALPLARRLESLRAELADGALSIADVAARGAELEEAERWAAMATLEARYLACLESWGLDDPVTAQLRRASVGELPSGVRRVVLAAVPDPPQLLVRLLTQWEVRGGRVDVLVAAPPEEEGAFDAWGRPLPAAWAEREIPLAQRDIVLCADPEHEASWIAEHLKGWKLELGEQVPHVAIGVPDAEVVPPLQRELAAVELRAFDPRNRRFSETSLSGLLDALLEWFRRPGYAETARLLRHPDVLASLTEAREVLRELDAVQAEHLPVMYPALRAAAANCAHLAPALDKLQTWHDHLSGASLAAGLRAALADIYAARQLDAADARDMAFREAVAVLDEALRELSAAETAGLVGKAVATVVLPSRLLDATIKPGRGDEELDLEGWLELGWSPAPVLVVAGMNEGMVPDSHLGDIFLPDALREQLELRDDRRRVARDAYTLSALAAQRRAAGRLLLLVGKASLSGDPLRPSRLLFRCTDEALVGRARRLFAQAPASSDAPPFAVSFQLNPARADGQAESHARLLERGVSATRFRDYLACPLRFYLRHILRMERADDLSREPDARAFGTLVHEVLKAMSEEGVWACGNAVELADWLEAALRHRFADFYGERPWLGVAAAEESAVRRLRAFASAQVKWQADGWDIVACEGEVLATGEPVAGRFTAGGVGVTGQIDRVDVNRNDGRVCVLDYKTTDSAKTPADVHLAAAGAGGPLEECLVPKGLLSGGARPARGDKRWIDLQLPVYRELVRARYGPDVLTGYIVLPATLADTGFALWDGYTSELHAHALTCMEAVAAAIREWRFWPPAPRRVTFDDFGELLFDDAPRFIRPVGGEGGVL